MKTKKLYTGKWAGLSARSISELLGISYYSTKKLLKKRYPEANLTLSDVGELVYEIRSNKLESIEESILKMDFRL